MLKEEAKRQLVLLSGGMDSTYLVYVLLQKGHSVDVLYVDGGQHDDKIKAERKACRKIINWLRREIEDERLSGKLTVVDLEARYHWNLAFGRQPSSTFAFAQAFPWFSTALQYADSNRHDAVSMAYVMNDQINPELHRFVHAWDALWDALKQTKRVELQFPLLYTSKQLILRELPEQLLKLTWVCEIPHRQTRENRKAKIMACNSCEACKRHLRELFTFYGGDMEDIERVKKRRDEIRSDDYVKPDAGAELIKIADALPAPEMHDAIPEPALIDDGLAVHRGMGYVQYWNMSLHDMSWPAPEPTHNYTLTPTKLPKVITTFGTFDVGVLDT